MNRIPGQLCLQPSIFNIDTAVRRNQRHLRCWQLLCVIWFVMAIGWGSMWYSERKSRIRFQESYDYLLEHPELSIKGGT